MIKKFRENFYTANQTRPAARILRCRCSSTSWLDAHAASGMASDIPLNRFSVRSSPWASAPVILFFNYFLVFTYIASAASTTKNSY